MSAPRQGLTLLAQHPQRPPLGRHGRKLLVGRSSPAEQQRSRQPASTADPSVTWVTPRRPSGSPKPPPPRGRSYERGCQSTDRTVSGKRAPPSTRMRTVSPSWGGGSGATQ